MNNLKQLGLALHNYHSSIGSFPIGQSWAKTTPGPNYGGNPWSAHAQVLGYLEQATVYNANNFSFAPAQALNLAYYTNSTILYTRLNPFICPSDGLSPTTLDIENGLQLQLHGQHGDDRRGGRGHAPDVSIQQTTGIFSFDNPIVHGTTPTAWRA